MSGVATQFAIQDRMTAALNSIAKSSEKLNRTLSTTHQLTNNITPATAYEKSQAHIAIADREVNNFNQSQQKAAKNANKIKSAWSGMGGVIRTALAAFSIKKIIELADSMTMINARLNLMNDGLQTTAELQDKIMASANRSRAAYQDTADIVSKMGLRAGDIFQSNDETIAFVELLNKQFAIAGASQQEMRSATLQLTQALGSGVLRGEEFNAVFEAAPNVMQTVADYLNQPIGKLRELAADGAISAEIVKNAMFASANEINTKFAAMPMTFAQVWTVAKNVILKALMPVIQAIGRAAQWIYDNWSILEPIFVALAAAALAYAVVLGIQTAATWIADGAAKAFFATLLANPLTWIALAIGVVVFAIYKWIQSVGGIKVAWLMACNVILSAWDKVKIGFMTGVYWVMNLWNKLQLVFMTASVNIQNFMGDMKAGVLMTLQSLVNGAINIINGFISALNKIPFVNIDLIEQVTFGTTAKLENEAAKQARAGDLAAYENSINEQMASRDAQLSSMKAEASASQAQREAEIASARAGAAGGDGADWAAYGSTADVGNVDKVGSVGSIDDDINIADEDLKFLRDVAEMRFVQNFVTLSPTVAVDAKISERVDAQEVIGLIETTLEDELAAAAEGVYA